MSNCTIWLAKKKILFIIDGNIPKKNIIFYTKFFSKHSLFFLISSDHQNIEQHHVTDQQINILVKYFDVEKISSPDVSIEMILHKIEGKSICSKYEIQKILSGEIKILRLLLVVGNYDVINNLTKSSTNIINQTNTKVEIWGENSDLLSFFSNLIIDDFDFVLVSDAADKIFQNQFKQLIDMAQDTSHDIPIIKIWDTFQLAGSINIMRYYLSLKRNFKKYKPWDNVRVFPNSSIYYSLHRKYNHNHSIQTVEHILHYSDINHLKIIGLDNLFLKKSAKKIKIHDPDNCLNLNREIDVSSQCHGPHYFFCKSDCKSELLQNKENCITMYWKKKNNYLFFSCNFDTKNIKKSLIRTSIYQKGNELYHNYIDMRIMTSHKQAINKKREGVGIYWTGRHHMDKIVKILSRTSVNKKFEKRDESMLNMDIMITDDLDTIMYCMANNVLVAMVSFGDMIYPEYMISDTTFIKIDTAKGLSITTRQKEKIKYRAFYQVSRFTWTNFIETWLQYQ